MLVDKRINYRGGGAYQSGSGAPGSAEAGKTVGSVGGPSYDSGPSISGRDTGGNQPSYERSRNQFIDKFNQDRTAALGRKYKPIGLDRFGSSNQLGAKGGLGNLFKTLFGFATGIPIGLFNKGKSGITSINNALGNIREDFTGYRTQQEYDDARQQRIDLNRINTIQNTLDTKYADGDYSMTDLDERLAALQQGLGIVPNTAAQNAQQFLDFSNQPELSYKGIRKLAQPETMTIPNIDDLMAKLATNSPALAQLRSLQKKQVLSGMGGPEFTLEDQQKLNMLEQMEADPVNIYSQTV